MTRKPRHPTPSARALASATFRAEWEAGHRARNVRKSGKRPAALPSGPAIARALEHLASVTGDPIFEDALAALRRYRLDRELKRRSIAVEVETFGDPEVG